jgi:hypothetical protein
MPNINLDVAEDRQRLRNTIRWAKKERDRRREEGDGPVWMRYRDEPLKFITRIMEQHRGDSWYGWRVVLKAAYGKTLDYNETQFFKQVAGGRNPPKKRVKELWAIVGRRGGKDSTASVIAVEAARHIDTSMLRPGEEALVPCIANTKLQARIVWRYMKGYFETVRVLHDWLANTEMKGNTISLKNRVEIMVVTNDFRVTRGFVIPAVVFDESAFYRSEEYANPDTELYNAVRPSMMTVPDAMMISITSPHMEKGLVFQKYREYFGVDDDDVLVIQAPTWLMNPQIEVLNPGEIAKAYEDDPEKAAAEYGAQFRKDLVDYVSREVVEAAIMRGVYEIAPDETRRTQYEGFVDPSGGSRDSFTMAIAHEDRRNNRAVLDALYERHAPFNPEAVVEEYAPILKSYGITKVRGDKYAAEWPIEQWAKRGITYEPCEDTKSDIYRDFLPLLNSGRCWLLDQRRLISQILALERRTVRGGRDIIDHPQGGYDDCANAAAGVLLQAAGDSRMTVIRRYLGV